MCKRSMVEVAGWKQGTTNEPQPEVPDFISSFLLDGTYERGRCSSLSPSLALTYSDVS